MNNKKIIIAIDGMSSCGKSTVARQLAKKLNYIYVDSGAMYRAITLYFLRNNVDITNAAQIKEALDEIDLDFRLNEQSGKVEIFLNDENVEYLVREMIVAEKVSEVAALADVRQYAVSQQQKMGNNKGVIMDGRDIGTVVFPDAELKIFMVADNTVRVERRFKELYQKNPNITIEEVTDAIEIDTTSLTPEEQLHQVLELANGLIK
jgi:cytidylate kinase